MSGCAHCVYDIYLEDLELYHDQLAAARAKLAPLAVADNEWPPELGSRDVQKGGDPKEMAERALQESYRLMEPSMRSVLVCGRGRVKRVADDYRRDRKSVV